MASVKQSVSGTAGVFIILGIIVAANIIIGQVRAIRIDCTSENLYTLSGGTQTMLKGLERDVTLKFYFSKSSESTPVHLKQYAQRIRDLLEEYETHSGNRIMLETSDPKPLSDAEEWAQKYGLTSQGLSMFGGAPIYLGLVAVSGTREAAIPFLDPGVEPQLEYMVTRLVHEVTLTERPKVGILSSLPVMGGPPRPPVGGPPQPPSEKKWTVISQLEDFYDVVNIQPAQASLPSDLTALVIIHPKDLSDDMLFSIDQFLLRGGRIMAFVDPLCMVDQSNQNPQFQQFGPMQNGSDLNKLSQAWGIELKAGKVVGDLKSATRVGSGDGGQVDRMLTWLSLRGEQINRSEVTTSSLEFVMMPFPGGFSGDAVEGVTATPLLSSSGDSGYLESFQAMGNSAAMVQALNKEGPIHLGLRLRGRFKTAFPGGKPQSGEGNDTDSGQETEEADALAESDQDGVVILIGDVDMLHDRNTIRNLGFFGAQPLNDNINLLLNFIEQITGSNALIGLRSRGTYERPFGKVIELQQQAQEKWQLEEQQLQTKIQETQSRLGELQRGKQDNQVMILSPEQQGEIGKLNDEVFKTRQQLKEVQKNLKRDIDLLGLRLKVFNIAAVPLVVGIFGVGRGLRRRKKATSRLVA